MVRATSRCVLQNSKASEHHQETQTLIKLLSIAISFCTCAVKSTSFLLRRASSSPFSGRNTKSFRTEDASGSTSQAANIMEALEMGSKLMLIDEDTTATNFMIRDARMQVSGSSQTAMLSAEYREHTIVWTSSPAASTTALSPFVEFCASGHKFGF